MLKSLKKARASQGSPVVEAREALQQNYGETAISQDFFEIYVFWSPG